MSLVYMFIFTMHLLDGNVSIPYAAPSLAECNATRKDLTEHASVKYSVTECFEEAL